MQRGKGGEFPQPGDQRVVDDGRLVQVGAAVHHPVPHRLETEAVQVVPVVGQRVEDHLHRRGVIGDAALLDVLADTLDDALGHQGARIRFQHRILHR